MPLGVRYLHNVWCLKSARIQFEISGLHMTWNNVASSCVIVDIFYLLFFWWTSHFPNNRYEFVLLQKVENHVQLLIVDSISSLITPILGGSGSQGIHLCTSITFYFFPFENIQCYWVCYGIEVLRICPLLYSGQIVIFFFPFFNYISLSFRAL